MVRFVLRRVSSTTSSNSPSYNPATNPSFPSPATRQAPTTKQNSPAAQVGLLSRLFLPGTSLRHPYTHSNTIWEIGSETLAATSAPSRPPPPAPSPNHDAVVIGASSPDHVAVVIGSGGSWAAETAVYGAIAVVLPMCRILLPPPPAPSVSHRHHRKLALLPSMAGVQVTAHAAAPMKGADLS